jgi:transposase
VSRLQGLKPQLVVVEATGGFETALVAAAAIAQLPIVVVNPKQVRHFAKAIGRLAKTDSIDAEVIARFAEVVRPEVRPIQDEASERLTALLSRCTDTGASRAAERTSGPRSTWPRSWPAASTRA